MSKICLILLLTGVLLTGCDEKSMNTNTPVNAMPTATPLPTRSSSPTSSNMPANSQLTPTPGISNTQTSNTGVIENSNKTAANTTSTPEVKPTPANGEKDKSLFSFPPPRVTSVDDINTENLRVNGAATTLGDVSRKLAEGLKKAGYTTDKYRYFRNDQEEFAIVTTMENIDENGAPKSNRWTADENLPRASSIGEYFGSLIYGKKSYYRVFAFVVTARREASEFRVGTPPDFEMAKKWSENGNTKLGGKETGSGKIENVMFTENYNCYVLLYLFVNHTSLDRTISVDTLNNEQKWLDKELVKAVPTHLVNTNINFGGDAE